jgi:Kef-type K+ transport system membrane component KefB
MILNSPIYMEAHTFLIQLVLILLAAKLMDEVAYYLRVPPVIGELVAGILIGPSLLGWVTITPPIHLLAQIGVILLLFEVGLETDIGRLTSSGAKAFLVAVGGVVLPFIFSFCVSYYFFGVAVPASLFIGSTLTATSIGITLRVLRDLKKQTSHESQIILGAAVLDDIIGIILLALLFEFSMTGLVNLWDASRALLLITLFIVLSPPITRYLSRAVQKWHEKTSIPGLLPAVVVSFMLLFAWIAYKMAAPELLGGFVVGLAFSKQLLFPSVKLLRGSPTFSHQVEKQMNPIVHLFTPIFFVSIGLSLNLKLIDWSSQFIWIFTGSLFLVAALGKLLSGFLIKESFRTRFIIGTAMIPRGEVGLIFANIGLTAGILKDEVYTSIILVIVLTTLMAPLLLRYIYGSSRKPRTV